MICHHTTDRQRRYPCIEPLAKQAFAAIHAHHPDRERISKIALEKQFAERFNLTHDKVRSWESGRALPSLVGHDRDAVLALIDEAVHIGRLENDWMDGFLKCINASAADTSALKQKYFPITSRLPSAQGKSRFILAGRERESRLFDQLLNDVGRNGIVVVHGKGGVGKSTLLRHVAQLARERDWLAASISADVERDPLQCVLALQQQLAFQTPTPIVQDLLNEYARLHSRLVASRLFSLGELNQLARGIVTPLAEVESSTDASNVPVADRLEQALPADKFHFFAAPLTFLSDALARDIRDSLQSGKALLLAFDPFEQRGDATHKWFVEWADLPLREGHRLIIVIAGRDPITHSAWGHRAIANVELENLSAEDTYAHLNLQGIRDLALQRDIYSHTRGWPLYVAYCADRAQRAEIQHRPLNLQSTDQDISRASG